MISADVKTLMQFPLLESANLEVHHIVRETDGYTDNEYEFDAHIALKSILLRFRALRVAHCQITFGNTDPAVRRLLECAQVEITGKHSYSQITTMMKELKDLIDTLTLCMYEDLWHYHDYRLGEPHKWYHYIARRFSQIYSGLAWDINGCQFSALFREWSTAVLMREVNALVRVGSLLLELIDQPLQQLLRDLEKRQREEQDKPMEDSSESYKQDNEDSHDLHDSHDPADRYLKFVKELCKLSEEIRSYFQVTEL